ncbi:MAG: TonB-dependent receptor plug domain-containing protein [Pseudanabaenales cyanobacterium]|nr:TonB-dependent receptor plug domain-containing protein [Pseudanabaenales cyanobacterium]
MVTGEEESRYVEPTVTTGTRTDTPLRDIPQSIQVIPQEVIEDQQVIRLGDALRNVSGMVRGAQAFSGERFTIRGFDNAAILRDGFRQGFDANITFPELSNLETVEVLKGPASILFGSLEPGGVINLISKQPLSEPLYRYGLRVGNRELSEPSLDISGPLDEDGRWLYRLNALYRNEDSFRDFDTDIERYFVAPTVSWQIGDRTDLTLRLEYTDDEQAADGGLVAIGKVFTQADRYALLSQIAPTVVFDIDSDTEWQTLTRLCAEVLGKQAEAEKLAIDYEAKLQKLKTQFSTDPKQIKISLAYFFLERIVTLGKDTFSGSILEAVGLSRPPSQAQGRSAQISPELLSDMDGDVLFVFRPKSDLDFAADIRAALDQIKTAPLWSQLKVVQAKQVYEIDTYWLGGGYIAANLVLDDLSKYVVQATLWD